MGRDSPSRAPSPTEAPGATPAPTGAPAVTPAPTEAPAVTPAPTGAPAATPAPTQPPTDGKGRLSTWPFKVISPLHMDDKRYEIGDQVELTAERAKELYPHTVTPVETFAANRDD